MNTSFSYMYRDASNYKNHGEVILRGEPAQGLSAFEAELKAALDGGRHFIASQVGLPGVFLWAEGFPIGEDDHCFHEFTGVDRVTDAVTDARTPAEMLLRFQAAMSEGWQTFEPGMEL